MRPWRTPARAVRCRPRVVESGSGGAGPCAQGPEGGEACFGRSGAVTRITKRSQHRVLTGLPSLAEEGGVAASGPVDVGFSGWTGCLLVGNPGGGTDTREQFGPAGRRFGKLLKVNLHGIKAVADFPAFEEANNPDGGAGALPGEEIDSNPNGLLNTAEDELPAGRLVRVNKDGSRTTLASEGLAAPGGFVLGHGAAYITNNSILSDAGQVVKVAI
jgi:hypothetical protein